LIKAKDEAGGVLSGHLKQLDDLTQKHLGLSLKAAAAYAAVAAGIVGATAELYKFADRMAELGDAMDEMSARTGVSVEELSKWSYVLQKDGASVEQFEGATRKLARAMYDASTGGKETAAAFAALGVDITGADGKLVGVGEAMLRVADGLKGTANESERTALMMTLLGRGSGELAVTPLDPAHSMNPEVPTLVQIPHSLP
ncbi:MAG: phage tail tape measure protein, partial [Syntrophobacteraceae bacterium]|nr:phage tail tape measure protein [Syntrophobacteraceae bacterium]